MLNLQIPKQPPSLLKLFDFQLQPVTSTSHQIPTYLNPALLSRERRRSHSYGHLLGVFLVPAVPSFDQDLDNRRLKGLARVLHVDREDLLLLLSGSRLKESLGLRWSGFQGLWSFDLGQS